MIRKKIMLSALLFPALSAGVYKEVPAAEKENLVVFQELESEESRATYEEILAEYTEETGVEIQLKAYSSSDYRKELEAAVAEGNEPDVYTGSLEDMTEDFNNGQLHNFLYLYDEENPYDPGESWSSSLPVPVKDKMYLSNKEIPGYPSSFETVRILCNKELFDSAHVEIPQTWAEFLESCKKLTDSGITPLAFPGSSYREPAWQWFLNSLGNQTAGNLPDSLDVNERDKGYVELNEFCKGVEEGDIDFQKEFLSPYRRFQELSSFWGEDFENMTQDEALEAFQKGEAAMVLTEGSSIKEVEAVTEGNLLAEAIPVPVVTKKTDENAAEESVLCYVQPEMIYGINSSLKKEGEKLDIAADFVQYMTSEEVQSRLAKELYLLPSNKNAALPEILEGFAISEGGARIPFFAGMNEEHAKAVWELLKEYISGDLSETEFSEKLQKSYETEEKEIKELNGWNITNNYGMPKTGECTMCAP